MAKKVTKDVKKDELEFEKAENRRAAVFASEIKMSYAAAGRPLSDDTILQVAESLSRAIPCKDGEIRAVFAEARDTDDFPTQKALLAALRRLRENQRRGGDPTPAGPRADVKAFLAKAGAGSLVELSDRMAWGTAV